MLFTLDFFTFEICQHGVIILVVLAGRSTLKWGAMKRSWFDLSKQGVAQSVKRRNSAFSGTKSDFIQHSGGL